MLRFVKVYSVTLLMDLWASDGFVLAIYPITRDLYSSAYLF